MKYELKLVKFLHILEDVKTSLDEWALHYLMLLPLAVHPHSHALAAALDVAVTTSQRQRYVPFDRREFNLQLYVLG